MTTFTTLSDISLSQDKPVTQSIARAWRDNPVALAEGDITAPEVVGVSPLDVQVASTSAALVFDNLPDGYDILEFDIVRLVPVTKANQLLMEVSTDNGATWVTTGYSILSDAGAGSPAAFTLTGSVTFNSLAEHTISGRIQTINLSSSAVYKHIMGEVIWVNSAPNMDRFRFMGYWANVAKVTAVRFRFNSGNITSGYVAMRRVRPA